MPHSDGASLQPRLFTISAATEDVDSHLSSLVRCQVHPSFVLRCGQDTAFISFVPDELLRLGAIVYTDENACKLGCQIASSNREGTLSLYEA